MLGSLFVLFVVLLFVLFFSFLSGKGLFIYTFEIEAGVRGVKRGEWKLYLS